jgi:HPt (histidine-containing phosphotransfer) domain-containing protein
MKNNSIDTDFLRDIIDNDFEFKKELFTIFIENAKKNITKLEEALKNQDNNLWYVSAHAFKGASASIGAFPLSKNLEYAQKHPEESIEEKQKTLEKIKAELNLVFDFIDSEIQVSS